MRLLTLALLLIIWVGGTTTTTARATPRPYAVETAAATQTTPARSEGFVNVYGARMHYIEAGKGPVVVLLHGLGGDASNWAFNLAPLAQKFRVIVPDQLGFGKSDKPLINFRIATYVDFLNAFLKELNIERATLVGNSLGGWVAAAYTLAHPERVERLVLVDAAGFALPPEIEPVQLLKLNPSTREVMKELLSRIFYNKRLFLSDAFVDASLAARINAGDGYTIRSLTESIIRREDILDQRLTAIRQPTLVIWGREDGLLPLADGQRFQKEIPNAQLVVFEQCGHVPQVEQASAFNAALLKFLNGEPAR